MHLGPMTVSIWDGAHFLHHPCSLCLHKMGGVGRGGGLSQSQAFVYCVALLNVNQ